MRYLAPLVAIFFALSAGWLGSLFTLDALPTWYASLAKSPLNPPSYVFAPVWTVLYLCMGLASFYVWERRGGGILATLALGLYVAQLAINALWSVVFFGLQSPEIAFVVMLLLAILILVTALTFYRVRKRAGLLLAPYFLWVCFALYLNLYIVLYN